MPILKYTASADTTITDAFKPYTLTSQYLANMGAADSLEVFSIYSSGSETQKARALVQFPVSAISQSRTSGVIPASGSVSFIFRLFNVEHPETLPNKYFLSVMPISSSWDEGYGLDLENLSDIGQSGSVGIGCNWIYRSTSAATGTWVTQGGDYVSSFEKQIYIDEGVSDLELDITNIVEAQISGVIPSEGLGIMLSGAYENGGLEQTYYTKRFSARSSEYFYKRPVIEARWESVLKDDRGDFYYYSPNLSDSDNIQHIYFYNRINGLLKNLPNSVIPTVSIFNESGSLLTGSLQSTKVSTGAYELSFYITGSSEEQLRDVWSSGSKQYFTGSIEAKIRTFDDSFPISEYVVNVTNLKSAYTQVEKPNIRIYSRLKNWSPNIYTIANSEIPTITFKNLYYKVYRIVDGLTIIDYGISPIAFTKCSYDKSGNYFDLDMSAFEKGYGYAIKLMLLNEDIKVEFPQVFRFKVE